MNRFNEESACELGRNYTNYMRTMIWGDEPAAPEKVACYGCGEDFEEDQLTAVNDGTPRPLLLCAKCLTEQPEEPECTCRMDADMADASCCEAHNPTNYREVA